QQRLARQLHPVLIVDGYDLDLKHVSHLADTLHLVDIFVVELADMAEAVAARENLDEGAEVLDRGDAALVDLADLDLLGNCFDLGPGGLGAGGVEVGNVNRAVVVDVDLGPGDFLNALDILPPGTDEGADFLRIDPHDQKARRPRADLRARIAKRRDNRFEN